MTHPSGIYNAHGRLVADRHGAPLTLIQDPHTGDKLWVTPTGHIHYRSRPVVTGNQADVDRLNALLRASASDRRPMHPADRFALFVVAILVLLGTCCAAFGAEPLLPPGGRWVEAIVSAYSPHDELDQAYHATKGADRWRTAYGVDVRATPYGIAAPPFYRGARVYLPHVSGYLVGSRPLERVFTIDDTGSRITSNTKTTGVLHLDVRYRTEWSALRFGVTRCWVYVVMP